MEYLDPEKRTLLYGFGKKTKRIKTKIKKKQEKIKNHYDISIQLILVYTLKNLIKPIQYIIIVSRFSICLKKFTRNIQKNK